MKSLCYLVRPGLAVTPSIGFTEIFVAFVQFGGDNQITFNTRAIYKLAPSFLLVIREKIVEEIMMFEVFMPLICLVKYF